ncbi:uncharacterized protein LOC103699786 [Phoenix dactylifera]|uniref:Uncharacterized protein LOC103699786 n=1 Tax=Phoenix dactylifera TaxID=42345 RepID=A0A8B7BKV3_PHODC|nr:uncharacterized protein LOC103699786 [Phoenix dactylifera]XP_008780087.1 uncharacterized protein LOC103699786 [Phoenix dactylifera]XP_008780124.1 uncharacterized protein LOC103699786 [Phoenix dactylifera]XP_008780224.1 uncharacterized protein LOC103699786 [Phoenix dactylifera]XP_026657910.1 uncharacterized protein LOC103699786 [Phoenix dactylifera]
MPSGAKKRKAARRKKEMGIHPPDSSTSSSSGNGESHDSKGETSDEGEEKKGESPRSESITAAAMDRLGNGKEKLSDGTARVTEDPPEEEKKKVVEEETVAEDAGAELVQTKDGEAGGGVGPTEVAEEKSETVASFVLVDEPASVTEEVVEATEAAGATLEASLAIDALAHENEVKPAPVFDIPPAPVSEQPRPRESGVRERSEADRATWWNCCGLFHVLASS